MSQRYPRNEIVDLMLKRFAESSVKTVLVADGDKEEYLADTIVLLDNAEVFQQSNQEQRCVLTVEVEINVFDENTPSHKANSVWEELVYIIGNNKNWGGFASNTNILGTTKEVFYSGRKMARLTANLQVIYVVDFYLRG